MSGNDVMFHEVLYFRYGSSLLIGSQRADELAAAIARMI